jgi:biopolymer transport protein ExbD
MSWKIRHEGSPRAMEGLSAQQVVEGMQDGLWEATDEVMGPQDRDWVAIESHPQFAEVVEEIAAPAPRIEEDESRLDMNPLIDVALVLLIFFILTASYNQMQRVLAMSASTQSNPEGPPIVTKARIDKFTIKVKLRQENGKPVIHVEDEQVDEKDLPAALSRYVRSTRKTEMVVDAEGVDWGLWVALQDAARGAGVDQAYFPVPSTKKSAP